MVNVCTSKGGIHIDRDALSRMDAPDNTATWYPIPHADVLAHTEISLNRLGYRIKGESHAVGHEGKRYFGLLDLTYDGAPNDYTLVAGIRNSHDKTFPAGLVIGSKVFVCDNLAFSGEISFARKHTRFISRDLPHIVDEALGNLGTLRHNQETRINAYKSYEIGDTAAHDFLVRSIDADVMPARALPSVVKQWRTPNHAEFSGRNAWSLFNAYTEVMKEQSPIELPKRTMRLHAMMDGLCSVALN